MKLSNLNEDYIPVALLSIATRWRCAFIPGSQQQFHALISALLVETLCFPGVGIEEADIC